MDRNTLIGFILIAVIFLGYMFYSTHRNNVVFEEYIAQADSLYSVGNMQQAVVAYEEARKRKPADEHANSRIEELMQKLAPAQDSTKTTQIQSADSLNKTTNVKDSLFSDSLANNKLVAKYGLFATAAEGTPEFYTIENDLLKITVSNKGGRPYSVQLKKFQTFDSLPLLLFNGDDNVFAINFFSQNLPINTQELYFKADKTTPVDASKGEQSLRMRLSTANGKYMEYVYTLRPDSYMVDFNIVFDGMNDVVARNTSFLDLNWVTNIPKLEHSAEWESSHSTIYYKHFADEVDYLSETSKDDNENVITKVKWIAYKQLFFSTAFIAHDHFASANMKLTKLESQLTHLKHFETAISLPFEGKARQENKFSFYFGPNHYTSLKSISLQPDDDLQLQQMINMGSWIVRWVNVYAIIPIFNWLTPNIANMGLIILILTLIIKTVLFPLTYRSYVSSAKMRVLKPQVDEINQRYPKSEDAMKKQQAIMQLYRQVGVNPLMGCIPVLLQMPILIAMFRFFPASIELRQKAFLWANDLSSYDSILDLPFSIPFYGAHISLFTLLMAAAVFYSTIMNMTPEQNNQIPGMKYMMYLMPVMMIFWFNSYSAGLSYYYFLSNLITIIQTLIIRRMVDEKAVLAKLMENKKKPAATKSKWQERMEEMAKKRGVQLPKK